MNDQLPPVEPVLRRQLSRRSSGPLPSGLLANTTSRLDATSRPRRWRLAMPRTVATLGSLAVVAAVVVAVVVVPSLRTTLALPIAGYPADRALTTAELADLMSGPALTTGTTFVAAVTIDVKADVCPMNRAPTIGVLEGMPSQVCAMDQGAGLWQLKALKLSGTYVFEYWAPGYLAVLAQVTPASERLAFRIGDTWPSSGMFLVDAWVHRSGVVGNDPAACPQVSPDVSGGISCDIYWLSDQEADSSAWRYDVQLPAGTTTFQTGAGVVLLSASACDGAVESSATCRLPHILTRLDDNPFAAVAKATPTPAPTSTAPATPVPPATPIAMPTTAADAQPLGVMGSGNRPLTVAEFSTLWAADPAHLAGRIAIAKGPVPAGFRCRPTVIYESSPSRTCDANVVDGQIAPEGYWAILVGADGMLSIVGELSTPGSKFAISTEEARALWNTPGSDKALVLVDAWIGGMGADACDVAGQPCYEVSWLAPSPEGRRLDVQPGAYHMFGGGSVGGGPAIQGIFLVQGLGEQGQILARLESMTP